MLTVLNKQNFCCVPMCYLFVDWSTFVYYQRYVFPLIERGCFFWLKKRYLLSEPRFFSMTFFFSTMLFFDEYMKEIINRLFASVQTKFLEIFIRIRLTAYFVATSVVFFTFDTFVTLKNSIQLFVFAKLSYVLCSLPLKHASLFVHLADRWNFFTDFLYFPLIKVLASILPCYSFYGKVVLPETLHQ